MGEAEGKTIEEIMKELDQIMEKLEAPDTSLEDSFVLYEAGMKLVRECSGKIDKVEKKILILQEGDGDHECV